MSNRVRVDWQVPESEWEHFCEYVRSEFDGYKSYLGREVEKAMQEYALTDGYEEVEQLVDRLVQAAGRTLGDSQQKINSFESGTTRVTARVDPTVKDSFKRRADGEENTSYGRVLAKALRAYREGGRSSRVKDKLERVVDDAESMLETVRDDSDSNMGKKERQTVAICSDLPSPFSRDQLEEKITEHAGSSDYYIDEYTELVTDRLGPLKVVERPGESDLFLTREQWRDRILAEVIDDLGGNLATNTCPAFTREEVGKAIVENGVDSSDRETINQLVEALLDRLGFVWHDEQGVYDSHQHSGKSATGTDSAEQDSEEVAAVENEFAALESGRRRAVTDGGVDMGEQQ